MRTKLMILSSLAACGLMIGCGPTATNSGTKPAETKPAETKPTVTPPKPTEAPKPTETKKG